LSHARLRLSDPSGSRFCGGLATGRVGAGRSNLQRKATLWATWSGIAGAGPRRHWQRTPLLQCNRGRAPSAPATRFLLFAASIFVVDLDHERVAVLRNVRQLLGAKTRCRHPHHREPHEPVSRADLTGCSRSNRVRQNARCHSAGLTPQSWHRNRESLAQRNGTPSRDQRILSNRRLRHEPTG
jgi:hypothetical protein